MVLVDVVHKDEIFIDHLWRFDVRFIGPRLISRGKYLYRSIVIDLVLINIEIRTQFNIAELFVITTRHRQNNSRDNYIGFGI